MDSQSQNNPPSRRPPGSRLNRPNPQVPHRQYAQGAGPAGQFNFVQPPQAQGQYARGGSQSQPPTNPGPTNPAPSPPSVTHKDPPADAEYDVMSYDAQLRAVIYRDDEFRRLASMADGRL
ncbi:hypothetical protein AB5N19_02196 [Seiridium cardinale]|uniref:Uncharacterized protein n=1 Tax=Seiridium cardinale TaxID=138064 RepID=A0ABR2X9W9_9PEZI